MSTVFDFLLVVLKIRCPVSIKLFIKLFLCNKQLFFFTGTAVLFNEPPKNVSVNIGETVSVHASVINANNVYWCKGRDHVISISTSFQEAFIGRNASLTLKNARPQDDGEYTCVAEKYGKNKKEIRKTFSIFVHRGKNVTLFPLNTAIILIFNHHCTCIHSLAPIVFFS